MPKLVFTSPSLIVLAGPSGAGKTRFARRVFGDGGVHVLEADAFREVICDDSKDRSINPALFDTLRYITRKRVRDGGRPAVIDSNALMPRDRLPWVQMAKELGIPAHLIVLDATKEECLAGLAHSSDPLPAKVLDNHLQRTTEMKAKLRHDQEGFDSVTILSHQEALEVKPAVFVTSLAKHLDIIGDIHGCDTELRRLLSALGYLNDEQGTYRHPGGRIAVFVGDLCDGGPSSLSVLSTVERMVRAGSGMMGAVGNHDWKLYRALVEGKPVMMSAALQSTLDEIERAEQVSPGAKGRVVNTVAGLIKHAPSHTIFDDGRLVVTHASIRPEMVGKRTSTNRRDPISTANIYGEHNGDVSEDDGRPTRTYDWAKEWTDDTTVVFGHDVFGENPSFLGNGNIIALDTGCVYGGRLTAMRWPEKEAVSVGSIENYSGKQEPALAGVGLTPLAVRSLPLHTLHAIQNTRKTESTLRVVGE